MCLLMVKPKNQPLTKEIIEHAITGAENNPDGFGIATVSKDNKIEITKTMFQKDFEQVLWEMEHYTGPMLIHSRIATHGTKVRDNCHPFQIDDRYAVAHNGILSLPYINQQSVDTLQFIEQDLEPVISYIDKKDTQGWLEYLSNLIGAYNKMAILDAETQDVYFLNESSGTWKNGVWYSNTSYLYKNYYYPATKQGGWNAKKPSSYFWVDIDDIPKKLLPYCTRWEEEHLEYIMNEDTFSEFIEDLENRELLGYIPLTDRAKAEIIIATEETQIACPVCRQEIPFSSEECPFCLYDINTALCY